MEIHKPKPWHGGREFLKEYAIIVLGVLTALAAEQIASSLEWRRKIVEARESLSDELGEDLGKADLRVRLGPCIDRRLDALAVVVDEAARTGALPPLPKPRAPPYNSWSTGVCQSALSAQTVAHMRTEELRAYTRDFQVIARIEAMAPEEEAAWTTLFGLAGPGRPFDAADARAFRLAIGQARTLNGLVSGFSLRARQIADVHHLPYVNPTYHLYTDRLPRGPVACETFQGTPPPPHYGASPTADFPDYARRNPTR